MPQHSEQPDKCHTHGATGFIDSRAGFLSGPVSYAQSLVVIEPLLRLLTHVDRAGLKKVHSRAGVTYDLIVVPPAQPCRALRDWVAHGHQDLSTPLSASSAEELAIDCQLVGSTTWKRKKIKRGWWNPTFGYYFDPAQDQRPALFRRRRSKSVKDYPATRTSPSRSISRHRRLTDQESTRAKRHCPYSGGSGRGLVSIEQLVTPGTYIAAEKSQFLPIRPEEVARWIWDEDEPGRPGNSGFAIGLVTSLPERSGPGGGSTSQRDHQPRKHGGSRRTRSGLAQDTAFAAAETSKPWGDDLSTYPASPPPRKDSPGEVLLGILKQTRRPRTMRNARRSSPPHGSRVHAQSGASLHLVHELTVAGSTSPSWGGELRKGTRSVQDPFGKLVGTASQGGVRVDETTIFDIAEGD